MSTKEVFLTPEGRQKLEEELDFLVNTRRPEVAQRIKEAKEEGDVSENAGYDEAKQQQGFLEGRIQQIEMILKTAKMIDEPSSTDRVQLGSTVTVCESDGGEGGPDALAETALAEMQSRRITSLFVVSDEGRPLGLIHIHDFLRSGLV